MTMEPRSGFSRPTSDFRKTDLPVPEGPSSTEISPGGKVRVTSLQMFWLPNDLVSPSTSTATPTSARSSAPAAVPVPRPVASTSPRSAGPAGRADAGRRGALLLTGNDDASTRLRASRSFRDSDVQELPRTCGNDAPSASRVGLDVARREYAAGAALPEGGRPLLWS